MTGAHCLSCRMANDDVDIISSRGGGFSETEHWTDEQGLSCSLQLADKQDESLTKHRKHVLSMPHSYTCHSQSLTTAPPTEAYKSRMLMSSGCLGTCIGAPLRQKSSNIITTQMHPLQLFLGSDWHFQQTSQNRAVYMRITALLLSFMLEVMRPAAQPLLHVAAAACFCPDFLSEL